MLRNDTLTFVIFLTSLGSSKKKYDRTNKDISMVIMWRNKYDPSHSGHHFYGPYIGHSSADNFVEFYESSFTLFSGDLPDMYRMPDGVTVN